MHLHAQRGVQLWWSNHLYDVHTDTAGGGDQNPVCVIYRSHLLIFSLLHPTERGNKFERLISVRFEVGKSGEVESGETYRVLRIERQVVRSDRPHLTSNQPHLTT